MTNLGLYQHYLGIGVTRDVYQGLIYLSLPIYIRNILPQFGLNEYSSVSTPINWKEYLKLKQNNTNPDTGILKWYQAANN